ncbi:DUF3379 domain-containing protein [Photobacterium nomapromontoriensis]|uniref:DUF3379 domain-containing protein n=1 Tax=Photobacterium nomapromontoriensis TaxID=2910237 RepID=UPI003D14CE40
MDDLEFRRRLFADPNDISPEMIETRNASLANRKLSDELQSLDNKLERTMKVDVPDDLADRILFHQTGQPDKKEYKTKAFLGLAASVVFIAGLFVGQFTGFINPATSQPKLAQMALEHIYQESPFVNNIDEAVSLTQVNAKMTPFGSQFDRLPGHVYYVNHCGFGDQNALHMIMGTAHGKVTVFIVPTDTSSALTTFADSNMQGVVLPAHNADLIVVGEKGQDITPVAQKLKSDLQWEI